MLRPHRLGLGALGGLLPVAVVQGLPMIAALGGRTALTVLDAMLAGEHCDRQPLALAVLDADQFAAAEHRNERAADRALERPGAHPFDALLERLIPGANERRAC